MFSSKLEEVECIIKIENRISIMSTMIIIIGIVFRLLGYPISYEIIFIPSAIGILIVMTDIATIRFMKFYLYGLSTLLLMIIVYSIYYTPILVESFK